MSIKVLHLLGGQVIIGNVEKDEVGQNAIVTHAYELMATPGPDSLKSNISLIPYGSLFGAMPSIVPPFLLIPMSGLVAIPVDPPTELLQAFDAAYQRSAEERLKIEQALRASQTDITKNGTL